MVRQRLFNDIYMDDLNCDSINIRGGQTSLLPHVHEAYTANTVTEVYTAVKLLNAQNTNATDAAGASATYEVRIYDKATGGNVNGEAVKDAAYQYDGTKWVPVKKALTLIHSGTAVYKFDPNSTGDKVTNITTSNVTAAAAGKVVVLDLVTMQAYSAVRAVTTGVITIAAGAISNAAMTNDYIGVQVSKNSINDIHLYKYVSVYSGFAEVDSNSKANDKVNYIPFSTNVNGTGKSSILTVTADAAITTFLHNGATAASTVKNRVTLEGKRSFTLTGHTPTGFAAIAAGGKINFIAEDAAAAGTDIKVPSGATLKNVKLTAGTAVTSAAGAPDIDIGLHGTTATTSAGFFDGILKGDLTLGAVLTAGNPTISNTLILTANAKGIATGSKTLTGDMFVTLHNQTAAVDAGDLQIDIEYEL